MQGDVFIWIEVLSSVNTPRLKDFTTRVADTWLAIKLKVRVIQYTRYARDSLDISYFRPSDFCIIVCRARCVELYREFSEKNAFVYASC